MLLGNLTQVPQSHALSRFCPIRRENAGGEALCGGVRSSRLSALQNKEIGLAYATVNRRRQTNL